MAGLSKNQTRECMNSACVYPGGGMRIRGKSGQPLLASPGPSLLLGALFPRCLLADPRPKCSCTLPRPRLGTASPQSSVIQN
eukprot:1013827-Pyramimonas_sp.AAC.1